jgi:glycogen synthase
MKIETIKFREKWTIKGCNEVVFDLWPGLPLIMEVDCKSEERLNNLCTMLGLDYKKGFTEVKYVEIYGMNKKVTQQIKNLSFKNFRKLLKKYIVKNKEIFNSLSPTYYKQYIPKKYYSYLMKS